MSEHNTTEPLRSSFADDPDMAELVEYFVSELPERVSSISAAFDSGANADLQTIAHQLKGASAGYGYEPLGDAAASLERLLKSGEPSPESLKDEVDALVHLCNRAMMP